MTLGRLDVVPLRMSVKFGFIRTVHRPSAS